ncbi:MAG: DUF2924 domain-containing protein [Rhodobacteraceae bacterium]|nr:MAG: DUF2924 domain-containing protein [Paracoccaceae bacterium]
MKPSTNSRTGQSDAEPSQTRTPGHASTRLKRPVEPAAPSVTTISDLEPLDLEGLRLVWTHHYGPPPKLRSPDLLRLILAWRLQADATGGLDRQTRRRLAQSGPVQPEGMQLGTGAILTRTWQGQSIQVVVEPDGFRHDGRLYPSLSAVATAVTGSRWNGPRFFGLRKAS